MIREDLAKLWIPQPTPFTCGPTSAVIALSAVGGKQMSVDRFFTPAVEAIKPRITADPQGQSGERGAGFDLGQLAAALAAHGAGVAAANVRATSIDVFRSLLRRGTSATLIVNFYGERVGTTCRGHFSPVGGYNPQGDRVLILDVARHRTPWHWVRTETLWNAMEGRGFIDVTVRTAPSAVFSPTGQKLR